MLHMLKALQNFRPRLLAGAFVIVSEIDWNIILKIYLRILLSFFSETGSIVIVIKREGTENDWGNNFGS